MTALSPDFSRATEPGIPTGARLLGWAGVVPFAAGAVGAMGLAGAAYQEIALSALRGYGVAILSFMAGVQWGVGMMASLSPQKSGAPGLTAHLAISVVPALFAWVALFLAPHAGLLLLAAVFALLLLFDLMIAARGIGPGWYRPLRMELSAAAIGCLIAPLVLGA